MIKPKMILSISVVFTALLLVFLGTTSKVLGQNTCTDLMKYGIYDEYNTTTDKSKFELARTFVCSSKFHSFEEAKASSSSSGFSLDFLELLSFKDDNNNDITVHTWDVWSQKFCKTSYDEVQDKYSFMLSVKTISPELMAVVKTCLEGSATGLKGWIIPDQDRTGFTFNARYQQVGDETATIKGKPEISPESLASKCTGIQNISSGTLSAGTKTVRCTNLASNQTYSITVHTTQGDLVGKMEPRPPLPTATLGANPTNIAQGNETVLSWTSINATKLVLVPSNGASIPPFNSPSGTMSLKPKRDVSYVMHVFGAEDEFATSPVNVWVTPSAPTVTLTSNKSEVAYGRPTTIKWDIANAERAFIDQGIGEVGFTDSRPVSPTANTTYTLTAINGGKTTSATILIVVRPKATFYRNTDFGGEAFDTNTDVWPLPAPLTSEASSCKIFTDEWVAIDVFTIGGFQTALVVKGPQNLSNFVAIPALGGNLNDRFIRFRIIGEQRAITLRSQGVKVID